MWKAKGDVGLAAHVDKAFDNAQYLTKSVMERPNFILAHSKVIALIKIGLSLITAGSRSAMQ